MSNVVFNIAKGRVVELALRVKNGDPAAARLYAIPVDRAAVTDATLLDLADFAAIITAGVTERATSGWSRITLAAADLTVGPDNTNDRGAVDSIDLVWTPSAGNVTDIVICYASVASPTNAQLVPCTIHAFAVTPTSVQETATVTDFFRAS